MANAWFRLYAEFADDPKVQMMPEVMQRRLIMLFCEHCKDVTVSERHRTFHWRISDAELAETKALFLENGFIDEDWNLLNWSKRQHLSDSSTERTRRYRERIRTSQKRHSDGNETKRDALDTDTDTDTDTESTLSLLPQENEGSLSEKSLFTLWNQNCGNLPKVEAFTEKRKRKAQARIRSGLTEDRFLRAVRCCTEKPFLRGENSSTWTATFDWLIHNDENIEKAINNPYGAMTNGNGNGKPNFAERKVENTRNAVQEALRAVRSGNSGAGGVGNHAG